MGADPGGTESLDDYDRSWEGTRILTWEEFLLLDRESAEEAA